MNQNLYENIFKRKSFHMYLDCGKEKISSSELEEIQETFKTFKPLDSDIKVEMVIVPSSDTTYRHGAEYCALLYSETKEGYLRNVGYIGEQLDLYLVSKNIGTLWCGIAQPKERKHNGLEYVIMICMRKIDDESKFRKDMFNSKRDPFEEKWIGDAIDGVSNIVRFAPSACNSQPWHTKYENKELTISRFKPEGRVGIMPAVKVDYFNRIDMGIYLCFLELCLEHQNIKFEKNLFKDDASKLGFIENAKYKLVY